MAFCAGRHTAVRNPHLSHGAPASSTKTSYARRCCPAASHMPRQRRLCTALSCRSLLHATGGNPTQGRRCGGLSITSSLAAMHGSLPGGQHLRACESSSPTKAGSPNAARPPLEFRCPITQICPNLEHALAMSGCTTKMRWASPHLDCNRCFNILHSSAIHAASSAKDTCLGLGDFLCNPGETRTLVTGAIPPSEALRPLTRLARHSSYSGRQTVYNVPLLEHQEVR